jgi:hypothetical protein
MLWSQFSAIFDNFRRKIWRFSQNPMLWSKFCMIYLCFESKMPFFRWIFRRKYLKNHNIGPRSGQFSPIGQLSTLGRFSKVTQADLIFGYFFHRRSKVFILTKKVLDYSFGDFFTNSSGHPAQSWCSWTRWPMKKNFWLFKRRFETISKRQYLRLQCYWKDIA